MMAIELTTAQQRVMVWLMSGECFSFRTADGWNLRTLRSLEAKGLIELRAGVHYGSKGRFRATMTGYKFWNSIQR